jgi:hypothetical protein
MRTTELAHQSADGFAHRRENEVELTGLGRSGNCRLLAAAVNSTVVAGENLTVGSTVWLPAESVAPGR